MDAHRKAIRAMPATIGIALIVASAGCQQAQVVRETVVVVATATLAPATEAPASSATAIPQAAVAATSSPAATSVEPALVSTTAPATEAPAPPATATPQTAVVATPSPVATSVEPALTPTTMPATEVPASPTSAPLPTTLPTDTPTVPPVAWNELPVLLSVPFLPAGRNFIALNLSPVTFSGPTLPVMVRFRVADPTGQIVFENTDNSAPWCALGDSSTGCDVLTMGNAQWPNGTPALAGRHTLLMTAMDAQQRSVDNRTTFDLNYAWGELPALGTTAIVPQGGASMPVLLHVEPLSLAGARPARVTFAVLDPNGNRVFERVDGDSPWCAFGDADDGVSCKPIRFDRPVWPAGESLVLGKHTLEIRAEEAQGATQVRKVVFNVEMLPREIEKPTPARPILPKGTIIVLTPRVIAPAESAIQYKRLKINGGLDMQLVYPEVARGSFMIYLNARRAGATANGEGVGRVEFVILDANGNVVNRKEESAPAFCAFGGNDPCNSIQLKEGATWPSTGTRISTGPYTVQVTVWGKGAKGELTGPWRGRARFDVMVPGQN